MFQAHRFRLLMALTILCSCVGCDQATKSIATRLLKDQQPRSYIADTIRLDFEQNPGGFLSVGATLPDSLRTPLFITTNFVLLLGLSSILIIKRAMPLTLFVSLTYILSGGVGNLIDRINNNGLVTDFMNVGFGVVRTGVFNVADIAITAGAIAIAFFSLKSGAKEVEH